MTLETIFTSLARRATSQEYLKQFQAYLGMALKAQAQCRATLGGAGRNQEPAPGRIRESGQHQRRASAGEQRVQPAQQAGSVQGGGSRISARAWKQGHRMDSRRGFFPLALKFKTVGAAQAA